MTKQSNAWMPIYWGDYLRDTGHLSTTEHGAYLMLIAHYWVTGRPLPDDDRRLARIAKMGTKKWRGIRPTIADFFTISGGCWKHKRIETEMLKIAETNEKRSEKAKHAARSRWSSADATSMPQALLGRCHPDPEPEPVEEKDTLSGVQKEKPPGLEIIPATKSNRAGQRGIRLPEGWHPDDELKGWALRDGADAPMIERETAKFIDYWLAKPGAGGVKLDWGATWRNWIRKALDDHGGRGRGGNAAADPDGIEAHRDRGIAAAERLGARLAAQREKNG